MNPRGDWARLHPGVTAVWPPTAIDKLQDRPLEYARFRRHELLKEGRVLVGQELATLIGIETSPGQRLVEMLADEPATPDELDAVPG